MEKTYVISPEEFGEFDDYEQISLTYYADHILADDMDDCTALWFWEMIDNLGIRSMTDEQFNKKRVDSAIRSLRF